VSQSALPSPEERFMRRAMELALRGRGRVEPNPMVGAVVVRDGAVVGEGWHQVLGGPHAEIEALRPAGPAARGADVYVTLEPCCRHGKTPPCSDALIAAGVRRVIFGAPDPTQGGASSQLRDAGIEVVAGFLRAECEDIAAPFFKLRLRKRPWVTAKWAMTADGRIATYTGDSRWISGERSRQMAHEMRGLSDAVLIGIGTALADDPLLTCRLPGGRNPRRVVLDRAARLPLTSQLVRTVAQAPVWVLCHGAPPGRVQALSQAGCQVHDLAGRPEPGFLDAALAFLASHDLTHVLIEGGAKVLASAFESRAVDEVRVFIAPKIVGGQGAVGPVAGQGAAHMRDAIQLAQARWTFVDSDALLQARVEYGGGSRDHEP